MDREKEHEKRLKAKEMWFSRRMVRIPWITRATNEEQELKIPNKKD